MLDRPTEPGTMSAAATVGWSGGSTPGAPDPASVGGGTAAADGTIGEGRANPPATRIAATMSDARLGIGAIVPRRPAGSGRTLGQPGRPARRPARPTALPRRLRRVTTRHRATDDTAAADPLATAIASRLPDVRLLTDTLDREGYRDDETAYLHAGLPRAVAFPTTTAHVVELVRIAGEQRVPIVPRGAGTGLSGGASGIEGGLTIAFTAMDRLIEIDRENLVAVVQPGIINANLKAAVAAEGLFYAPDPASYEMCSIGGNLGTNAGGLCCVKYGQTRDAVLSLEVVMADGAVIRTGGRNVKDVAGYSLTHLFVGSQGTLAITTEATLKLRPAPPPRSTMLAFFPTLDSAGQAVAGIAAAGLSPVTLELLDRFTIAAVDDMNNLGLDRTAAAMLMVESDMPGVAATDELERAETACRVAGATDVVRAADAQEADWLRQARRAAHYALERLGDVRMEDVGVPRSRVPDMLREIERIAAKHDVRIGTFGHAGDGNLHPDLVLRARRPAGRGQDRRGQDRPVPGRARARRHGHRRARHRLGAAGVARDPARRRRGPGHARDQDRARPAGHPQPGARRLGRRGRGGCAGPAGRPVVRRRERAGRPVVRAGRPVCGRGRAGRSCVAEDGPAGRAYAGRPAGVRAAQGGPRRGPAEPSRPEPCDPDAAGSSKIGACGATRRRGRRPPAGSERGRASASPAPLPGWSAGALDVDQTPVVLLGAARAR